MNSEMYENIGAKIKGVAWGYFIVNIIISIIGFIVGLCLAEDAGMIFAALGIAVANVLLALVISYFLYGFGELIDKQTETAENTQKLVDIALLNNATQNNGTQNSTTQNKETPKAKENNTENYIKNDISESIFKDFYTQKPQEQPELDDAFQNVDEYSEKETDAPKEENTKYDGDMSIGKAITVLIVGVIILVVLLVAASK